MHMADNAPTSALDQRLSLSVDDASMVTGLGRTKLFEAIRSGALPSVRVGGRRVVLVEDLRQYLTDRRQPRAS
jgi:excisionase family DNA binding protein